MERGEDVLDRIDQIVQPETRVDHLDNGWESPALQTSRRRRRRDI